MLSQSTFPVAPQRAAQYYSACCLQERPNEAWQRHCYMAYGQPGQVANQILQYGQPSSLEDFAALAQIANYVQYK